MKNRFLSILLVSGVSLFFLAVIFHPVMAKDEKDNKLFTPPEIDGTYDVPGRPDVKVRVFVHKARGQGGKPVPSPTTAPVLKCDLADPDSEAEAGVTGWHLLSNWTYNLNPASVPSTVGGGKLSQIAADSFSVWTGAIGGKVNLTRGADTNAARSKLDGQNIIAWGRTSRSALGVTYIWYYTSTKEVADVDTIMNKSYPWSWSGSSTCAYPNSYDAQNILTHELGHWMGMDDMYTDNYINNTMYGYGSVEEAKKDTLTNGDKAGVSSIY
ncbi:hypothetical protein A3D05_06340 [Candidatus Gottesmanbacteria bacterium RIFCSPHIGHO2_02_FULL_40_24]|nr:MAG: hypothetical protein A3D05_06340 [Candidatus Gottesmanbacteria bacterium RIFCSPHIGHO2_02_FULL_40_24]OGG22235.1 MAG: hypothetical protein A3B48_03435 [Candidatus Gottesmanbacteria bacterium RIFCSPLOWO2_01_FULL_40_10]